MGPEQAMAETATGLPPAVQVFLYGLATALATGLGALPFAFGARLWKSVAANASAIASGLMLGASYTLWMEGGEHGAWQTAAGVGLGILFIRATDGFLERRRDLEFAHVRGAGARQMLLMLVVMTVHSFSEGVAVGASFAGGARLAAFITAAIAIHNVPEGLAITAVLRPRGVGLWACAAWSVFSSLPQPLMAVPAYLFVEAFRPALPYSLGFAAGAMVYMVFVELLPEAYEHGSKARVGLATSLALVAMLLFQQFL